MMPSRMWALFFLCGSSGSLGSEEPGSREQLQALHCPPCQRIHCSSKQRLQCEGGVTTGVCGCCPACARTQGETCGGTWDYLGKCDEGLVCVDQEPAADQSDAERSGLCQAVTEQLGPEMCNPECTKEYCQVRPSAVCSARFVSLEKKACQGSCQHTSCSGCFMLRRPSCPHTCSPSNATCLHHFGKCVHTHLRARSHPVCHGNLQSNGEGHFVCLVPEC